MKELLKILMPIVLLFIIVAGHTGIASGQSCLDNDSIIHYTNEMDKKCLTCLVNSPKKDSLIINYLMQIDNLGKLSNLNKEKSGEYKSAYKEEKEISLKLTQDLNKSKKWNKKIAIGGPLIGLILGILVAK